MLMYFIVIVAAFVVGSVLKDIRKNYRIARKSERQSYKWKPMKLWGKDDALHSYNGERESVIFGTAPHLTVLKIKDADATRVNVANINEAYRIGEEFLNGRD